MRKLVGAVLADNMDIIPSLHTDEKKVLRNLTWREKKK
jgi:hypothetical protein